MDRMIRLKSDDFNCSYSLSDSSSMYYSADEDGDSTFYQSVSEVILTDNTITDETNHHSQNLENENSPCCQLSVRSSTPKPKRSIVTNLVLAVDNLVDTFNDPQIENNLLAEPNEISRETSVEIDTPNSPQLTEPATFTNNETSLAVVEDISQMDQMTFNNLVSIETTDTVTCALPDPAAFTRTSLAVAEYIPQQINRMEPNNLVSIRTTEEQDSVMDNNFVDIEASTAGFQQSSSNDQDEITDPQVVDNVIDNAVVDSSSLVLRPPADVIPKIKNRLTGYNPVLCKLKPSTPMRRKSGKFVLNKPSSMYVSAIPKLGKRVTLNVNNLMPFGNLALTRRRKSILKKTPKKKPVSAGTSGPKVVNVCEICNKSFNLKKTLMEHGLIHLENESVNNNCKYCDHKFQKAVALEAHLKENCSKIPASKRRKLFIDEFEKLSRTSSQALF